MAIKISSTTVIDNSRNLTNINDLNSSGISTIGTVKITSGIITSTNPGVSTVTYYGDGSKLSGIILGVGIQSNTTRIGTGITDLRFVGAGVTAIGVTTAVVTVNKTLLIGTRTGVATINVSSGISTIQLRTGVGNIYV